MKIAGPSSERESYTLLYPSRLLVVPGLYGSWCNLEYGKQAARKLDIKLRHTTSADVVEQVANSANRAANIPKTSSFASGGGGGPFPRLVSSNDGRTDLLRAMSHHRRAFSSGDHPQAFLGSLGASATSGRGGSGRDGGGLERVNSDTAATPESLPPDGALPTGTPVRRPATLSRAGNGAGGASGGDKLIALMEMMAKNAREKVGVQGSSGATGTPRSSTVRHAPAVAAATAVTEILAAPPPSPRSATMPTQSAAQVPPTTAMRVSHGWNGGSAPAASRGSYVTKPGRSRAGTAAAAAAGATGAAAPGPVAEALEEDEAVAGGAVPEAGVVEVEVGRRGAAGAVEEGQRPTAMAADVQAMVGPAGAGSSFRRGHADGPFGAVTATAAADAADGAKTDPDQGSPAKSTPSGGGDGCGDAPDAVPTASERWEFVRQAVWDGRVALLPWRSRYSVVSAAFLRLFPEDFDRAIPVINFKEVDLLLMRADQHMAAYEYVSAAGGGPEAGTRGSRVGWGRARGRVRR
jgi:hypothetical protein